MPTITALILTRFREGAKKVASWLTKKSYESLFLDLPKELEKFLSVHIEGEAFVEDLWRSYSYLTGFQEPFINAMRYTVDPILDALAQFRSRLHELKVYCYQDLEYYMEARKLSERLLILETKSKMSSRIGVEEWRRLLRDEVEGETSGFVKSVENIAEEAIAHPKSVVLYQGTVKPFKNYMESEGFTVETIYLQHYWRSPLEALRVIARTQGVDHIPDDVIARCVQHHLRYIDYVLSSEDIDAAHEKWTLETHSTFLGKTIIVR